MPKQALLSGSLENGPDFDSYNELDVFRDAIQKFGWSITNIQTERAGYSLLTISNGSQNILLHLYIKKVMWRHRSEFEKGIQFPADHITDGYENDQTDTEKTIIIGVYKRSSFDDYLLCAWQRDDWGNRGKAFNCFIDVNALAAAYSIGFSSDSSKLPRKVYAFRPEFIHYYIANHNILHGSETIITPRSATFDDIDYHQKIFFGSPGSGKSKRVKDVTEGCKVIRTTFHPDTDYNSFVGSYKPVMINDEIKYKYIPQSFIKSYLEAWLNPEIKHFLVIEEINRGNCAQIFGDVFQCLDRCPDGYSEYEVDADKDLSIFLKEYFASVPDTEIVDNYKQVLLTRANSVDFDKILLPPNLYIYATMNTSDQSLFPMDSAFKRRWDWEYIPIDYEDAKSITIEIDETSTYNWGTFIETINPKIKDLTGSEDKQIGNRFVNPPNGIVTLNQFRSKVLFYLWSEIYKDESQSQNSIFKYEHGGNTINFQFSDLYAGIDGILEPIELIKSFLSFNGVPSV